MLNDSTNNNNIKMFLLSILAFFVCLILIVALSVFFGMHVFDPVSHALDRPVASMEYHDHRVDFSDNWTMDVLPSG